MLETQRETDQLNEGKEKKRNGRKGLWEETEILEGRKEKEGDVLSDWFDDSMIESKQGYWLVLLLAVRL